MEDQLILPQGALLEWYQQNKRDLPWRRDREPYHVWLSEIMLQQTRAEAVKRYYPRFLEALPSIESLAECDAERLYKLWEGLGYYSRARNLKKAAQVIMDQYKGRFPREYDQVLALPGVGVYTAGAICSIAFSQPKAAVDGNVLRVVSRLRRSETPVDLPDVKKQVSEALEAIYPAKDPGTFTQALMELGATVCLPKGEPKCDVCPCREFCLGKADWKTIPAKLPKKERRQENHTVFVFHCGDEYAIEKRPARGLLAGLWQFPNCPGLLTLAEALDWADKAGVHPENIEFQIERSHIFTHIRWDMRCYYIWTKERPESFTWLTLEQIDVQAALPSAFCQFRDVLRALPSSSKEV